MVQFSPLALRPLWYVVIVISGRHSDHIDLLQRKCVPPPSGPCFSIALSIRSPLVVCLSLLRDLVACKKTRLFEEVPHMVTEAEPKKYSLGTTRNELALSRREDSFCLSGLSSVEFVSLRTMIVNCVGLTPTFSSRHLKCKGS